MNRNRISISGFTSWLDSGYARIRRFSSVDPAIPGADRCVWMLRNLNGTIIELTAKQIKILEKHFIEHSKRGYISVGGEVVTMHDGNGKKENL